jgi:hypothetical protein
LDHPAADPAVTQDEILLEKVALVLEKKETGRPITSEDYLMLARLVASVEGRIIASRAETYAEARRELAEMRKKIPAVAWKLPLEELDLPGRIHNLLLDNEIESVGDVLFTLDRGDEVLLGYRGFGDKMLETLKEYVAVYKLPEDEEVEDEAVEEEIEKVEEEIAVADEPELVVAEDAVEEEAPSEIDEKEQFIEAVEAIDEIGEEDIGEEPLDEPEEEVEEIPDIDDLSKSIFEREPESATKKKPSVVVVSPTERTTEDWEDDKAESRRGRQLVFDEDAGEVVVKRKRKRGRGRPDWDDFDAEEF